MTIQANQGFGVSVFGAVSGGGGGSTSPGGSSGQVQYNASGSFAGMAGTSWDDTNRALTLTGATVTTSQPVLNLSQTWNAGAVTFTGLKFNVTNTASAAASMLFDLQVGGSTYLNTTIGSTGVNLNFKAGASTFYLASFNTGGGASLSFNQKFCINDNQNFVVYNSGTIGWASGSTAEAAAADLILRRAAAATLQLGAADAAAPVAQTLQVQSVVAGTSNTAGTNWTLKGSAGTGTGAGGSIIFQVAPAGSSGTAQNAYATALTIASNGRATFAPTVDTTNSFAITNAAGSVIASVDATNRRFMAGGAAGGAAFSVSVSTGATTLYDAAYFGWMNGADAAGGTTDVRLYRDAADTLALRRPNVGATSYPQTFNVYKTYTDASNYERLGVGDIPAITGNNGLYFTKAGTGSARNIYIWNDTAAGVIVSTNAGNRWQFDSNGHFLAWTDNAYDIGASGTTNRVRTIYSGGGYSAAAPTIKTADYSQGAQDYSLIFNGAGSITLTLLAAATYPGKILYVKTIAAQTVVSASSNVKPIDTDTAGTAILAATAGKWAMLQSDGTNWVIMAQG